MGEQANYLPERDVVFPQSGDIWEHYKGRKYVILKVAVNSDSGMHQVVYLAPPNNDQWFTRDLNTFMQHFQVDGKWVQRYRKQT